MDSSELQDIAACQTGDLKAFDPLYLRHVDKIYKYVFRRTLLRDLAEDITSQTFLKAIESIRSFDPSRGDLRTWLYRIARNTLIDYYRRNHPTVDIENVWDLASDELATTEATESVTAAALHEAMKGLSPREREIVFLRVWEGLSYREIADALDLTEGNAKVIFSRTLGVLRTRLPSLLLLLLFLTPIVRGDFRIAATDRKLPLLFLAPKLRSGDSKIAALQSQERNPAALARAGLLRKMGFFSPTHYENFSKKLPR